MYEVRGFVVVGLSNDHRADAIKARLEQLSEGRIAVAMHVQNGLAGFSLFSFGNHGNGHLGILAEMAGYLAALPVNAEGLIQYTDAELNENHTFEIGEVRAATNNLGEGNGSKDITHRYSATPTPD